MAGYNTLQHGSERTRTIKANGTEVKRREIYCVLRGFYDLFMIGGVDGFNDRHAHCNQPPSGRGAEFAAARALRKAA